MKQWADDLNTYALRQAINTGRKWPNLKLVQGNTKRKYGSDEEVIETLLSNGYNDDDVYEKKLKNMTQMKKMLGVKRFGQLIEPLLIRPTGKPQLVPTMTKGRNTRRLLMLQKILKIKNMESRYHGKYESSNQYCKALLSAFIPTFFWFGKCRRKYSTMFLVESQTKKQ